MNDASEDESVAFCSKLFADHLDGNTLRSNRSLWNRFVTLRNRNWFLLGGGAATGLDGRRGPHRSLLNRVGNQARHGRRRRSVPGAQRPPGKHRAALAEYEAERQPPVARFQEAARDSARYFDPSDIISNSNRRHSPSIC